jgi:hypothetical protein
MSEEVGREAERGDSGGCRPRSGRFSRCRAALEGQVAYAVPVPRAILQVLQVNWARPIQPEPMHLQLGPWSSNQDLQGTVPGIMQPHPPPVAGAGP